MRVAAFKFRIQISSAGPQIGNHCLLVPNSDECGGLFFGNVDSNFSKEICSHLFKLNVMSFKLVIIGSN